ncbi:MAG: 50S ribosomal protein L29 [Chloroflexi bacterium]|nr:50S ribosomal protein L29 [Chloroflexota bacterium]
MKATELRALSDQELQTKLDEAYQELFNLRFQQATRQLTNTSRIAQVRKDIARIKTLLRERQLAATA